VRRLPQENELFRGSPTTSETEGINPVMENSMRMMILRMSLVLAALAACGGDGEPQTGTTVAIGIESFRAGVPQGQFAAMPDTARLLPGPADGPAEQEGVMVRVHLALDGFQGRQVPFSYALHHAASGLPLDSRTIPITPGARTWKKEGWVWLPLPGPGGYYAQVAVNDSTGRAAETSRTPDFTVD
jgi:hypothetical protein